jgi:hypothetical protein
MMSDSNSETFYTSVQFPSDHVHVLEPVCGVERWTLVCWECISP